MRKVLASRWARRGLALLSGTLPALAFPAPSLWWLAYAALVPWMLLARSARSGREAAVTGWLGGTGFMLALHHWLMPSLHVFILLIAALIALLWAPWGWLVRRMLRGAPGPGRLAAAVVVVPSGWLLVELIRSWQYLGGPWGLFGATQWQVGPALRLASVGGVWLVSFLLVAVNTALVVAVAVAVAGATGAAGAARAPRARAVACAGAAVVLGVTAVGTAAAAAWAPRPERTGGTRVALVQIGLTDSPKARFDRGERLTRQLAGRDLDLVVWGESSVGYDLGSHPALVKRLSSLASRTGASILVNVDSRRAGRPGIYKSSVLVGPHGLTGQRYDKMRLVPFGEYIPARSVLGWATSVGRAAGEDRRRGTEPVMMKAGGTRFGPLICFETAFPDMSRHLVSEGARLLVAQSATSSFQESWAPQQHASLAALRAAESGRPMVHSTLTGVSAVHGPEGERVGKRLDTDASAAMVADVPLASGTTLYVRFGDWVVRTALTVLVAFGALECARTLRARRAREAVTLTAPARR
ncbi:apolipoprotein N-acyltransferase [Streptomyces sp. NPDC048172]|uniref:apolipoprotein N-acyltransferase n=1 Tax=Streptomyces sp. NPDC048172 TaxID=3365505 RepID=UPI0037107676